MSLTLALNNALSGLKVSQQSLAVLSQNIANANNENYSRQSVSQTAVSLGGQFGSGTQLEAVNRNVDDYISKAVVTRTSTVSKADIISQFYQQVQIYLGQPGSSNSIDTYTNDFFNSLGQLATSPESASLKTTAVNSADKLASQVSELARNVEELRFDADKQIKESVNSINTELSNLYNLNRAVLSARSNNESVNALKDSIDVSLKKISAQIDISYRTNDDGTIAVSTEAGISLVGTGVRSQLDYTAATSVEDFITNIKSSPITVYSIGQDGGRLGLGQELVGAGNSENPSKSRVNGGTLAGLLQMRDKDLPDVLSQLDSMADSLRDSVNAISNTGSSFPPPQSLTGGILIDPKSTHQWSGNFMVAALDQSGNPITSPYASDVANSNGLAPLTVNLGALDDGLGAGTPSFQSIIDEINQYYSAPQPRAGINGLTNVQLVSHSDSLAAGTGNFKFDVNLTNLTAGNTSFRVTGAAMSNGAVISSPASFPTADISVATGQTVATTGIQDFTFDMSAATPGPYTITLSISTTDANGVVTPGTVSYTVPATASALRNDKFAATSATGGVSIENPTTNQAILTAKLVDANGVEVAKNPSTGDYLSAGYLKLEGATTSTRVALAELTSNELGDSSTRPVTPATNFGFSHYMGLNNFFMDNGKTQGAAINLSIRKDILDSPDLISTGQLTLSTQPTDTTKARHTYGLSIGNNNTVTALSNLGTTSVRFAATSTTASTALKFSEYAAQILGVVSSKTAGAENDLSQLKLIQQGFIDKDDSTRGVNIDEEMANTVIFQNAYSANARVISVTKQLFDDLINIFQ